MPLEVNDLAPFVVVGASAVTALSTIAGVRLANKSAERQLEIRLTHQDEKDKNEALRTRLEELYQLVDSWAGDFVVHHTTYRSVMEGELTYNQALDITIDNGGFDAARLFTLADLYFPKSHSELEEIRKIRDELASIQSAFKARYKELGPATDGARYSKLLTPELLKFSNAIDAYKSALATYAREV